MKKSALKKVLALGSTAAVSGMMFVTAFAAEMDIKGFVGNMLGYVVDMFTVVGVLIAVYAMAQFALAFKDDNPEQKSRSTILLVVGAILVGIRPLVNRFFSSVVPISGGFL